MVIGSRDYTHFTPKHVTNDILKYKLSKMNTKELGDSRVNRCFPPPEVKNLETRILINLKNNIVRVDSKIQPRIKFIF